MERSLSQVRNMVPFGCEAQSYFPAAKARRIEKYHVVIEVGDERTECNSIDDFHDHAQPLAPGALIKTVRWPQQELDECC